MKNIDAVKKYFIDVTARMSQVIFTLLIVTPFVANVFSWALFISGTLVFILVLVVGTVISSTIGEE